MRRAERAFQRHGFWPLVQTRFLPLPFPVVNFGAALAGIGSAMFLSASFLGLFPSTLIHTYFIATLMEVESQQRVGYLIAYGACFVVFNLVIGIGWLKDQWSLRRTRGSREINTR
jgi:uncharacterized membrane protein YdjX (TVP38/TMEM64 family)